MDYHGIRQTEVVVIDLPSEKPEDVKIESQSEIQMQPEHTMDTDTAGGDGPLVFDFLSLSKLEQRCGADGGKVAYRPIVSTNYFDCNPLDAASAFGLRNRMMRKDFSSGLDDHLAAMPIWIIANAKDQLGTTFVGCQRTNNKISTFHTRCLGRFGESCESTIKMLDNRFKHGLEAKSKALALYSILGNNVSSTWGPRRCLSKMTLTFKWDAKVEGYLCAPPPSASAVFHFAPGWKDKRVALLEATEQLEFLLLMANVLDSGSTMVWPPGNEGNVDGLLEEVRQLIARYRIQNDDAERTLHGTRHVDFTELLWDILKKCPDYKALVADVHILFLAESG
ncbi:hypothetical protein COOONC_04030 [Cooperia oncophora]